MESLQTFFSKKKKKRFANFVDYKGFADGSDDLSISERMSKQYDDAQNWEDVQWLVK